MARQDLDALEDDNEKDFEKKKNAELQLCQKTLVRCVEIYAFLFQLYAA